MFTTSTRTIASVRSWSVGAPVGVWFWTGKGLPSKYASAGWEPPVCVFD